MEPDECFAFLGNQEFACSNTWWPAGCGFADLDGHRWNVLYMDLGKMPKN